MISFFKARQHLGFSLTELTICLALVGVIAALTLPKVLSTTSAETRIASFKNAMSSAQSLVQAYYTADSTPSLAEFKTFSQNNTKNRGFSDPLLSLSDGTSLRFTQVNLIGSQQGIRIDIDVDGGTAIAVGDDVLPMLANFSSMDINQASNLTGSAPGNMLRPGEIGYLVDPNVSTVPQLNALYAELNGTSASGATGQAVTTSAVSSGSGGTANDTDTYGSVSRNNTAM